MHVSKFTPEQLVASLVSEHNKQAVISALPSRSTMDS